MNIIIVPDLYGHALRNHVSDYINGGDTVCILGFSQDNRSREVYAGIKASGGRKLIHLCAGEDFIPQIQRQISYIIPRRTTQFPTLFKHLHNPNYKRSISKCNTIVLPSQFVFILYAFYISGLQYTGLRSDIICIHRNSRKMCSPTTKALWKNIRMLPLQLLTMRYAESLEDMLEEFLQAISDGNMNEYCTSTDRRYQSCLRQMGRLQKKPSMSRGEKISVFDTVGPAMLAGKAFLYQVFLDHFFRVNNERILCVYNVPYVDLYRNTHLWYLVHCRSGSREMLNDFIHRYLKDMVYYNHPRYSHILMPPDTLQELMRHSRHLR